MTDLIKQAKIKNPDEETSEYIPFGADAENVFLKSGKNLEEAIGGIKTNSYFNNLASLKNDTELKIGSVAETLGYYNAGDGGQGKYYIVSSDYEADELTTYALASGLRAKLVARDGISSKQIGFTSDGSVNSDKLNAILKYCGMNGIPFYIDSDIAIDNPIVITTDNVHIIGRGRIFIYLNMGEGASESERFYIFKIKNYDLIENTIIENIHFINLTPQEGTAENPYYIDVISSDSTIRDLYFKKVDFAEETRINAINLGMMTFEECSIYNKGYITHLINNCSVTFDKCYFDPFNSSTNNIEMKATNQGLIVFLGGFLKGTAIHIKKDNESQVRDMGIMSPLVTTCVLIETITE